MAVVSIQDVSVSFGGPPLLEHVDLQVEKGERIALIGRNGEGKSTLLGLMASRVHPDSGRIILQRGISVESLEQDLPKGLAGTVSEVAAGRNGTALSRAVRDHEIAAMLTKLSLNPGDRFEYLSVGFKRRVLLARALATDPDLLLLDEPTNHLDIPVITWLEAYLQKYRGTLFFVTHDRLLLRKLATRIMELDRGRLFNWECDYKTFLDRRDSALEAEEVQRKQFLRKLEKEEEWIRQGVKARRTRNEGRVRSLMKMREEQQALRMRTGSVRMQIEEAERTGKLVFEAEKVSHGYDGNPLIKNFSARIMRGDRIGIIGPNGVGKTTLLRILLGEIRPEKGRVRHGAKLKAIYFDQLRAQLNEDQTVQENIAEGKEYFDLNGSRRHVIGYLKDFLFSPDRSRSPVHVLSGGERNRLLLARLFSKPSNVLVLDEPTNDLDMETLELLEERLLEYSGTILLVSHDREFLNDVVTGTFVFEDNGVIREYAGGYDDWIKQRSLPVGGKAADRKLKKEKPEQRKPPHQHHEKPRKLTFKETRELEELPRLIEKLEAEQKTLYTRMADPTFYRDAGEKVSAARAGLEELEHALEQMYSRWQELENIREET